MTKPVSLFFYSGFLIIFAGILSPLIVEALKPSPPPLPQYFSAPEFTLESAHGQPVSASHLKGRVSVLNFIFTRCRATCPAQTANVARLARRFAAAADVQFFSITVDPDYDSHEVLKNFSRAQGADNGHWQFLRGEKTAVLNLLNKGLKLGHGENEVEHTTRLVLIDRKRLVRGFYDGLDAGEMERLARDIKRLNTTTKSKVERNIEERG